jgi:hypothetical protein
MSQVAITNKHSVWLDQQPSTPRCMIIQLQILPVYLLILVYFSLFFISS